MRTRPDDASDLKPDLRALRERERNHRAVAGRWFHLGRFAAIFCVLGLLASPLPAAVKTWTGAAGNGKWNDDSNWSPPPKPGSADDVKIPADSGIIKADSVINVHSLTMSNSVTDTNFTVLEATTNVVDLVINTDGNIYIGSGNTVKGLVGNNADRTNNSTAGGNVRITSANGKVETGPGSYVEGGGGGDGYHTNGPPPVTKGPSNGGKVDIKAKGDVLNGGNVTGGLGGDAASDPPGADGRDGGKGGDVGVMAGGSVTNAGTLRGGAGGDGVGNGGSNKAGSGGGVTINGGDTVNNQGTAEAGNGGDGHGNRCSGGDGGTVNLHGKKVVHQGKTQSGQGGTPAPGGGNGKGGGCKADTDPGGHSFSIYPGSILTGETVDIASLGGSILMPSVGAATIVAETSISLDTGSRSNLVDLTGIAAGVKALIAGNQICIRGAVALDLNVTLADVADANLVLPTCAILTIESQLPSMALSWPVDAFEFVLEQSDALPAVSWLSGPPPGATNGESLTAYASGLEDAAFFRLRRTNECSLAITNQPTDLTAAEGSTIYFSVASTGVPAPSAFQWQKYNLSGSFTNIVVETNEVITVGPIQVSDHLSQYRVRVRNGCTGVFSAPITLHVEGQ